MEVKRDLNPHCLHQLARQPVLERIAGEEGAVLAVSKEPEAIEMAGGVKVGSSGPEDRRVVCFGDEEMPVAGLAEDRQDLALDEPVTGGVFDRHDKRKVAYFGLPDEETSALVVPREKDGRRGSVFAPFPVKPEGLPQARVALGNRAAESGLIRDFLNSWTSLPDSANLVSVFPQQLSVFGGEPNEGFPFTHRLAELRSASFPQPLEIDGVSLGVIRDIVPVPEKDSFEPQVAEYLEQVVPQTSPLVFVPERNLQPASFEERVHDLSQRFLGTLAGLFGDLRGLPVEYQHRAVGRREGDLPWQSGVIPVRDFFADLGGLSTTKRQSLSIEQALMTSGLSINRLGDWNQATQAHLCCRGLQVDGSQCLADLVKFIEAAIRGKFTQGLNGVASTAERMVGELFAKLGDEVSPDQRKSLQGILEETFLTWPWVLTQIYGERVSRPLAEIYTSDHF